MGGLVALLAVAGHVAFAQGPGGGGGFGGRGGGMRGAMMGTQLVAGNGVLYVLRGNELMVLDGTTLAIKTKTALPAAEGMGGPGGPGGGGQ
jgi:hypothetical protein